MRRPWNWLAALGTPLLLAAGAVAAPPPAPGAAPPPAPVAEDRELQALMDKLNALNDVIARNAQAADAWRYCLEQGELMLQIGAHSHGQERDHWLRMGVESEYAAALQCADAQRTGYQYLVQLPGRLARAFPGSPVVTYAALQEIQADYLHSVEKLGEKAAKEHLCERLLEFARQYPATPEAPKKVAEAAKLSESLGNTEAARRCYRYLAEHFAGQPAGRKAEGSLWRLSMSSEPMRLQLPLLYPSGEHDDATVDLAQLHGKVVVVYFWSTASPQTAQDFEVLHQLSDRYQDRGLEVVYVNLDDDPGQARTALAGRLTGGVHLFQKGGLDSEVAAHYCVESLPQVFVLGVDGLVVRHGLQASQLEPEVRHLLTPAR